MRDSNLFLIQLLLSVLCFTTILKARIKNQLHPTINTPIKVGQPQSPKITYPPLFWAL